jgi:hypothetical protein
MAPIPQWVGLYTCLIGPYPVDGHRTHRYHLKAVLSCPCSVAQGLCLTELR